MLLTRKELNKILRNWRISITSEMKKELLDEYGNFVTDEQGRVREYTEQDIYEQLRKKLYLYGNKLQGGATLS